MKKNAVLLMGCLLFKLDGFPVFFIRYTSSGPSVDTNAYLILQLVSTVIGVALFREKLVEGFKTSSSVRLFETWRLDTHFVWISNCGRSVYWRSDVG